MSARGSARRATALPAQCILRALRRPRGVLTRGGAQAHVEQAAADISSILASEKKKKTKKLDANKMAALALIFNPVRAAPAPALPPRRAAPRRRVLTARARVLRQRMAVAASHSAATGHWAKTDPVSYTHLTLPTKRIV